MIKFNDRENELILKHISLKGVTKCNKDKHSKRDNRHTYGDKCVYSTQVRGV